MGKNITVFAMCVGIGSVRMGEQSICNKGDMMLKRPPMATSGKPALAGKRSIPVSCWKASSGSAIEEGTCCPC